MKCLGRLESMALAAVLAFSACSGQAAKGTQDEGDGDDGDMKVNPGSLARNPQHLLTCDRPLTENPSSTQLSRLTIQQYVNSMRDLFEGLVTAEDLPEVKDFQHEIPGGTFANNVQGQIGSEATTQAQEAAVLDVSGAAVKDLPKLMGCKAQDMAAESGCVDSFLEKFGLRAWRRPLIDSERTALKSLFGEARKELDFANSVRVLVGAILESPQFLFRIQEGTGEVGEGQKKRLSDYEVASNLSYLIWNTMPDSELFQAAAKGELSTAAQVEQQARRMLDDPRGHESILEFQRQWLHIERMELRFQDKDKSLYPNYGPAQVAALERGTEKFLESAFWEGDHSLKQLYTSSKGYVNDSSAEIFGVAKPGSTEVVPVDLDSSKRKGLLTQPAILAGWADRQKHSAILRGAYIMETVLCAPAPAPPPDAPTVIQEVPNANEITHRKKVELTVERGSCLSCHKIIDGFGFLFENYDAIGAYQTKERHLDIDASNEVIETYDLDGRYDNGVQFAEKLANSEQAAQCAVQNFYEFALSRQPVDEDGCMIAPLTDRFLKNGMNMQELFIDIIKSQAFRYRSVAQ